MTSYRIRNFASPNKKSVEVHWFWLFGIAQIFKKGVPQINRSEVAQPGD